MDFLLPLAGPRSIARDSDGAIGGDADPAAENYRLAPGGRRPRRIDRLVHHATMITLKGKSYRLRERGVGVAPAAQAPSLRDSA